MIEKVSWKKFLEKSKEGIYLNFYTSHISPSHRNYKYKIYLFSLNFPTVKCFNINWPDAKKAQRLDKNQILDFFISYNGKEIFRFSAPNFQEITEIFIHARDLTSKTSKNIEVENQISDEVLKSLKYNSYQRKLVSVNDRKFLKNNKPPFYHYKLCSVVYSQKASMNPLNIGSEKSFKFIPNFPVLGNNLKSDFNKTLIFNETDSSSYMKPVYSSEKQDISFINLYDTKPHILLPKDCSKKSLNEEKQL